MRRPDLAAPLAGLALLLAAASALHAAGLLRIPRVAGVPLEGWRFPGIMALFLATAAACSILPAARSGLLLAVSLLQLFLLHDPARVVGALALWTGFYHLVHSRIPLALRVPLLAVLHAAPFLLVGWGRDSIVMGVLLTTHFASGFVLRSALYAYEAIRKGDQLRGAGFKEYLLYLVAAPLGALPMAPIGFVAMHRGFASGIGPELMRSGVRQMALGLAYLTVATFGNWEGLPPSYAEIHDGVGDLDVLTAAAAAHMVLLDLFLHVTGPVHVVVGMLRVLGFDLAPGSDRPYTAPNLLHFWRRWNTYYRDFLLTLAYYPVAMALKRRPYLAVAVAGPATFALMGFAHALVYFVAYPEKVTLRGLLGGQTTALVYGLAVTALLLRDVRAARARIRRGPPGAGPAGWWPRVRHAGAVVLTLTAMGVLMITFSRPSGVPREASLRYLGAFFRAPGL